MIHEVRKIVTFLIRCNIYKTLYFNFKMLPFRQAIKLPVYVYGKVIFREMNGHVVINTPIQRGMIKIGKNDYYLKTAVPLTNWVINGLLVFNGTSKFLNGGYLCISRNGELRLGDDFLIGSDYKIMCFEKITFGNSMSIAYNVQFYDTSFHYIELSDGNVQKLTSPIVIGNYVWIGNSSVITKNTRLSDYSIVANGSLVNKDYSSESGNEGCLLAGSPAKVKKLGMKRVFDENKQKELDLIFGYDRTHL